MAFLRFPLPFRGRSRKRGDNSDCRNKYGLYWVRVSDLFPEAVCHRSPGACSGLSLSFASLWKGAWEGNACRKSAGTVRDGCLYLSVERRVVKTVCRLFCRGFGKMARVYELLLLRRSLGRYRGKSGYSAMTPDPTSSSPSYQAANCPGVIPR